MKIATHLLRRYLDVPTDGRVLRDLFDDTGLEVKRIEQTQSGEVYTLELLANRGDHHCYAGIARELGGRLGGTVTLPSVAKLKAGPSPFPVRVESERCLVYTATLLERPAGSTQDELPAEVLRPLTAAGIHAISPAVDASNLANLELGQPTHAFDLDAIVGAVVIRDSKPGEKAWPLFTEEKIELPKGTLVIADEEKILAVAGVIGCEESKTTAATTRLLLESATFDPVAVRIASRALGILTDSSARFERGADPTMPLVGAGRVTHLLETHAGWRRVGDSGVHGSWSDPHRTILLELPATALFVEHPLTVSVVTELLSRYGFEVEEVDNRDHTLRVRVPPHRLWDVEYPADLYEELLKAIGYNVTPSYTPPVDMGSLPDHAAVVKRSVEELLVGNGFYEVFTDGFYGRDMLQRAGIGDDHPLAAHVETQNALERAYSMLKNNGLLQAVDTVAVNLRRRTEQIKAYEWTRTFHPSAEASNKVCEERALLWAVACGSDRAPSWTGTSRDADPLFIKGIVEEIATELRIDLVFRPLPAASPLASLLHPNRRAGIFANGLLVGVFGEVHPAVCRGFRIKRERPVYLEIDVKALREPGRPVPYVEPSEHHPIIRNLAFTLPHHFEAGEVAALLRRSGPAWLRKVEMVDVFVHEEAEKKVRTVTYELNYDMDAAGRTAEEVNAVSEYLIGAVEQKYGSVGVKLR